MPFVLRESDELRSIKAVDGQAYHLRQSAYGFGTEVIFYAANNVEIEHFLPSSDYTYTEGVDIDDEKEIVTVHGEKIHAKFTFSEWYNE